MPDNILNERSISANIVNMKFPPQYNFSKRNILVKRHSLKHGISAIVLYIKTPSINNRSVGEIINPVSINLGHK